MRPLLRDPIDEKDPAASFQRILPELRALPARRARRVSSSVTHLVQITLGSIPNVRTLRPRIDALPGLDRKRIDQLEKRAIALGQAQIKYLMSTESPGALPELAEEALRTSKLLC